MITFDELKKIAKKNRTDETFKPIFKCQGKLIWVLLHKGELVLVPSTAVIGGDMLFVKEKEEPNGVGDGRGVSGSGEQV
ncbi:hypothetical protein [Anaerotalea alkaliphila]|uniref:Uncharacterized protein n=1 Tax=Anaerotalea alkaliphila TaxID=2662126 RepID=A0A7X5HXK9_9FIRM|nr:hypothetical protein [Anaerotalea alkaliphila]NDL68497.1 hypothetical protein [Anaerotalea alkaliphila]